MNKLKTIRSYTGLARFLAETEETGIYVARASVPVKTPYAYSPTKEIVRWQGRDVLWFETAHRVYDVFEVPLVPRYTNEDDAVDYNGRLLCPPQG